MREKSECDGFHTDSYLSIPFLFSFTSAPLWYLRLGPWFRNFLLCQVQGMQVPRPAWGVPGGPRIFEQIAPTWGAMTVAMSSFVPERCICSR